MQIENKTYTHVYQINTYNTIVQESFLWLYCFRNVIIARFISDDMILNYHLYHLYLSTAASDFLFVCYEVAPPGIIRPSFIPIALWIPCQGMSCNAGCQFPECVANLTTSSTSFSVSMGPWFVCCHSSALVSGQCIFMMRLRKLFMKVLTSVTCIFYLYYGHLLFLYVYDQCYSNKTLILQHSTCFL